MADFNSVLKQIGFSVGAVTGGPSQVKAVAGAVGAQGKINAYLNSIGQKLGGIVGPDLFQKLADGAQITGDAETRSFVDANVITGDTRMKFTAGLVVVLVILGYFFYRKGGALS